MDSASLMSIRVIPKGVKEETGHHALERLHHTPYRDEVRLFSCLQRGDLKKLIYELGQIGIQNITVGQMSENDLQQQKYMAVSFITLATRYAIQGGLGESNAYAYSDDFIRRIDAASTKRTVHAAIVDGASYWQKLFHITLPLVKPSLTVATVLNIIYVFNSFPIVWTITKGDPASRTDTLVTYLYKLAFYNGKQGEAAAVSVIGFLILLVCASCYMVSTLKKGED